MADRATEAALRGRKAVVTGGAENIGRAVALAFVDAGAEVAVFGRRVTRQTVHVDGGLFFG